MEEVTKETGHRPSVSMPSLDSTDDFPTDATAAANTDSVFVTTDSFISTASTETITSGPSTGSTLEEIPISSTDNISQSVGELSSGTLIGEASSESLVEGDPTTSFAGDNSSEVLIENASARALIEEAPAQDLIEAETEALQQEVLDDSQVIILVFL